MIPIYGVDLVRPRPVRHLKRFTLRAPDLYVRPVLFIPMLHFIFKYQLFSLFDYLKAKLDLGETHNFLTDKLYFLQA